MNGPSFFLGLRGACRMACLLALMVPAGWARAADLPTAAGSPIAGINFDDRPLMLPVQRNFQMAMLTASTELGRTCGKMEAYGWRLGDKEQGRVNQIFNNTVDRMRAQGYAVQTQNARAVSKDVTLFTADREDKRLMFLWSAGDIGLVMVLCQTTAPLPSTPRNILATPETAMSEPALPREAPVISMRNAATDLRKPIPLTTTRTGKPAHESFSPLGQWSGSYTCAQGATGATLSIDSLKGDQFKGTFHFYPTSKNPDVPDGKYEVSGEYDRDGQRILINPGKWIERPKNYYNTIMIGSFDPSNRSFSAYFQGITGCTSFEAHQGGQTLLASEVKAGVGAKAVTKAKAVKKAKKHVAAKKPAAAAKAAPVTPKRGSALDVPSGIDLPVSP